MAHQVIEHVEDPIAMLAKSSRHLLSTGFVYIEVPDGESAAVAGSGREEFFIDHLYIFSLTSLTSACWTACAMLPCMPTVCRPVSGL